MYLTTNPDHPPFRRFSGHLTRRFPSPAVALEARPDAHDHLSIHPPIQDKMSRSRAGCATCKKRHRKCDETRPVCLACKAQGLKCDGYDVILRWGAGIASRGQFAGASSPVARGSGSPRRPPTLGPADTSTTPPMAGPSNSGPGRPSTQAPAVARNPLPLPQRTVVEQNEDDRILRECKS